MIRKKGGTKICFLAKAGTYTLREGESTQDVSE